MISYYKTYGITIFFKHVDANHILIATRFKEKVNDLLKEKEERQPSQKRANLSSGSNLYNICSEGFLQKGRCATKRIPKGLWFNVKSKLY